MASYFDTYNWTRTQMYSCSIQNRTEKLVLSCFVSIANHGIFFLQQKCNIDVWNSLQNTKFWFHFKNFLSSGHQDLSNHIQWEVFSIIIKLLKARLLFGSLKIRGLFSLTLTLMVAFTKLMLSIRYWLWMSAHTSLIKSKHFKWYK